MMKKQHITAIPGHTQTIPSSAIVAPEQTSIGTTITADYHKRLFAINTIKQLVALCRETQQHRGLGMGLLAGNEHFTERFSRLQLQMKRRIQILDAFCHEAHCQLSQPDLNSIRDGWQTIREGWHDDSVLENFQFHGHFIEQQLKIIARLSRCLQEPLGASTPPSFEPDEITQRNQKLLTFTCNHLPHLIEFTGKIRALSTHAATSGHAIVEHDKQLKYFCQCIQTEKRQTIYTAEELHRQIGSYMPSLLLLQTYEFKLSAFTDKVLQHIVGQKTIPVTSNDIFSMATEIMDTYWRVVDDGLDVLLRQQEQALEQWCQRG